MKLFPRPVYKSALTGTHSLLGREKVCSMQCFGQGHNEQTHRQGIQLRLDLDPNPESCTLPLDQLAAKKVKCFESTSSLWALLCWLWQVPSLVNGLVQSVYIHLDIHLSSLGSIQPLTCNLTPRLTNLPSQVLICSWVKKSNAAWSALLRAQRANVLAGYWSQDLA